MGKTVILSVNDGEWNVWGDQFVKRQPQGRKQLLISRNPSVDSAKKSIITAIQEAGAGGTLIISVGHGSVGANAMEGMVDLAPSMVMRLGGLGAAIPPNFVSVFYDVNVAGPPSTSDLDHDLKNNPGATRLAHWKVYQEIATTFKAIKPYKVVLLSCRVGGATDFLRKIANDWQVVVQAYKVQVALDPNPPRFKVYLVNHPPPYATAADTVLHEEELPYSPADTVQVGPPP